MRLLVGPVPEDASFNPETEGRTRMRERRPGVFCWFQFRWAWPWRQACFGFGL